MPLTAVQVRNAKATGKTQKLFDGGGMYLEVSPKGGKWWRYKYRYRRKEKRISLGVYPDISLKDARERHIEARKLLANGVDPSEFRKTQKEAHSENVENSFENIAREWFLRFKPAWKESHSKRIMRRLEADIFPWLGHRPIQMIDAPELLSALRRVEERGAVETAHRIKQTCGQVFRYAIATGRAERDPSQDLKGALPPPKKSNFASITKRAEVGGLLRAIHGYQGHFVTQCALKIAPLVFVRPGELRHAEWSEVDFENSEWRIPAEKMKMNAVHIVPLSKQAVEILMDIQPLTGRWQYVFPSVRSRKRPMSENTILGALRRMGYTKEEMTGHGFRSMASTLLNEQGWNRDAIERQLAHAERDGIRAAYNYAEYLPIRREMMQAWADYLDTLRESQL